MSNFSTLSEFLLDAGTQYHVFDLGRGIRELPAQQFLDIEQNAIVYPFPRVGFAWFGIVYWNKQLTTQHFIWFIKLPIDEAGMLQQASRNHLLQIIIESLESQLDPNTDTAALPEHPYRFEPTPRQMADFNAISRKAIGLPISEHVQLVQSYIQSPHIIDWQTLPLQGMADFCLMLGDEKIQSQLASNFSKLHPRVIEALCGCMENHVINENISMTVLSWCYENWGDNHSTALAFRALARSEAHVAVAHLINKVLMDEPDESVLVILAARHWQQLADKEVLTRFFNQCLVINQTLFEGLYIDLVRLPQTRPLALELARSNAVEDKLQHAFAALSASKAKP